METRMIFIHGPMMRDRIRNHLRVNGGLCWHNDPVSANRAALAFVLELPQARCENCGNLLPLHAKGYCGGSGYGVWRNDDGTESKHCYVCCSRDERYYMVKHGKGILYDVNFDGRILSDWPGLLRFYPRERWSGYHNMAGRQYYRRFRGPDGYVWTGRRIGDNTQIVHVRRTKAKAF